jgi:hypothetical protein
VIGKRSIVALLATSPRDTYWDIEPFTRHRTALTEVGFTEPPSLVGYGSVVNSWRLAKLLDVDILVARRITALATVATGIDRQLSDPNAWPDLRAYRVELLAALAARGPLAKSWIRSEQTAQLVAQEIKKRCNKGPSKHAVREFLAEVP